MNVFFLKIKINGQEAEIQDTFALSDFVIDAEFGGGEKLTMQLLSKAGDGSISLQYMGTKVCHFESN